MNEPIRDLADQLFAEPPHSSEELERRVRGADRDALRSEVVERLVRGDDDRPILFLLMLSSLGVEGCESLLTQLVSDGAAPMNSRAAALMLLGSAEVSLGSILDDLTGDEAFAMFLAARLLEATLIAGEHPLFSRFADVSDDEDDDESEHADELFDDVVKAFLESKEGIQLQARTGEVAGSWARAFIVYAWDYRGFPVHALHAEDVEALLTETFPAKVTTVEDEGGTIIPELKSFWRWIGEELDISSAKDVLDVLEKLEPEFPAIMADESRWGIAKTFVTAGDRAGFDMSDPGEANAFMEVYNRAIAARSQSAPKTDPKKKKKHKRKVEKISRRKNRRK